MADTSSSGGDRSKRIASILEICRQNLEDGGPISREAVASENPDLMPELGQRLDDLLFVHSAKIQAQEGPPEEFFDAATLAAAPDDTTAQRSLKLPRPFGDFELLEEIGRGGMGVVYKARQLSLDRLVSVKMILAGRLATTEDISRFHSEARAAAGLRHPNIITVYEVGERDGQHFFSMYYVKGKSLSELIQDGLTTDQSIEYVQGIAKAIHHAHQQRILHRDLKPSNVLIEETGRLLVTDFGLAKRLDRSASITATSGFVGTPSFMSPEQVSSSRGEIGVSTDIYGIGATLYAMLTNRPPFQSDTVIDTVLSVLEADPIPPSELNADVSRDLEYICLTCLQKDPTDRFVSAEQLAAELEAALTKRSPRESEPTSAKRRLAVLPLTNISDDSSQDYFCDGMTEEMINHCGRIDPEGLSVIARTSVMQYKDAAAKIARIGRELNVDYVLEGSVRRSENRVRITSQLIEVHDESQLWSESFERDLTDIFKIQREVAERVAESLSARLSVKDSHSRISTERTMNPAAYETFLKGRHHWEKRTHEDLRKALSCYNEAIELDPLLWKAYAGLAECYVLQSYHGELPPDDAYAIAKKAIDKALEINDRSAEAYSSLAVIKMQHEWDWSGAESAFIWSLEIDPGYATAHLWYAWLLSALGRHGEALEQSGIALDLDPLSPVVNADRGRMLYYNRAYDEAVSRCQKTLYMDPSFPLARLVLGLSLLQMSEFGAATEQLERAVDLSSRAPYALSGLAYAFSVSGQREQAVRLLDELTKMSDSRYVPAVYSVGVLAGLGDEQRAIEALERAVEERSEYLVFLGVDPVFDSLRANPRFTHLLQRMNLYA